MHTQGESVEYTLSTDYIPLVATSSICARGEEVHEVIVNALISKPNRTAAELVQGWRAFDPSRHSAIPNPGRLGPHKNNAHLQCRVSDLCGVRPIVFAPFYQSVQHPVRVH